MSTIERARQFNDRHPSFVDVFLAAEFVGGVNPHMCPQGLVKQLNSPADADGVSLESVAFRKLPFHSAKGVVRSRWRASEKSIPIRGCYDKTNISDTFASR